MRKIYQLGLIVALGALLPTNLLFAGDGNGDGKGTKNAVSMKGSAATGSVTFTVYTAESVVVEEVDIIPRNPSASVKEINPIVGGFEVVVDFVPVTNYDGNPNNDDVIIFDIVGVDNITGVDGSNNNDGTHIHITVSEAQEGVTTSNGNNNQDNGGTAFSNPNNGSEITPAHSSAYADISVYPNPVRDQTNVVTVGEILGRTINIMDLTGKMVMSLSIPNSRQTVLNLSELNPGVYILNFETEDGRIISKRIQKI